MSVEVGLPVQSSDTHWLTDAPPNNDEKVYFGFQELASQIVDTLPQGEAAQFTLGVVGEFGSGKTCLMRAIERQLPNSESWGNAKTVWFNAWRYEHETYLVVPLLYTILKQVVPESKHDSGNLWRFLTSIAAGLKFGLAGVEWGVKDSLQEARRTDTDNENSITQHDSLSQYCDVDGFLSEVHESVEGPIIVFIDDLDRCTPGKVLGLLDSLKAFMESPGFLFIIGLNPNLIPLLLEDKYGKSIVSQFNASNYLQKMFQASISVPPIDSNINEFNEYIASIGFETAIDPSRLTRLNRYSKKLTCRQLKRIANLKTTLHKRGNEIDWVLLAHILTFAEQWPDHFTEFLNSPESFFDPGETNDSKNKDQVFTDFLTTFQALCKGEGVNQKQITSICRSLPTHF